MNEESHNSQIDPQLEARIVALVLGEASDFERDELARLIDQRPELAAFQKQIQSVHGLLGDVGMGESVAKDEDWKLSPEKRGAVLAVIRGESPEQPSRSVVKTPVTKRPSLKTNLLWNFAKIAAVFCVVGFFGIMALSISIHDKTSVRSVAEVASREARGLRSLSSEKTSLPSIEHFLMDREPASGEESDGERDYAEDSKSALLAIQDNLAIDATVPSPTRRPSRSRDFPAALEYKVPQEGVDGPESAPQGIELYGDFAVSGLARGDAAPPTAADDQAFGSQVPGQAQSWMYQGQSQQPAVNSPRFSIDLVDPPVAGKEIDAAGFAMDGERQSGRALGGIGGDGYGGGGIGGGGSGIAGPAPDNAPRKTVEREIASLHAVDKSEKSAATKPIVAGMESSKPTEGFLAFDAASVAKSLPSPTNESLALTDGLESKVEIATGAYKGRITVRSDAGITLPKSRSLEQDESFDRHVSEPVAGTAISQPRGALQAGQAKQEGRRDIAQGSTENFSRRWGALGINPSEQQIREAAEKPATTTRAGVTHEFEKRAKDSLSELSVLNDLNANSDASGESLPRAYEEGIVKYQWREALKQKGEQDKSYRLRAQLDIAGESVWSDYVPPMLKDNSESMKKSSAVKKLAAGLDEKNAANEAFSTFSLHVSDVSFKLAQAALARGEWPEAAKIRIEEFVNAFDYGDPMPGQTEKVACRLEQSIHPFLQQRNLLRVSMRTAAAGRASNTPLRLTFLLDNSGSMERIDRQQTVRRAFALLAQQLKPIDQVTLISFARGPRLLADKVSGAQAGELVSLIDNLPSEGGTNIEAALQLAFEKAQEQRVDNAQNRIILLTDGAVNLGDANPENLSRMITTMRGAGIAFDAAGICAEGLNDEVLEALTRKGDGRYYLLDSLEAAEDGFARQIAGALRPSAKNVKVQIEFNPKRVGRYKLLGFEKHRLKQEDFRNDKVDAAEMAAAEAGVAVYQFEAKPNGEGDVGSVSVRFRDLSTGQMIENRWPIPYEADAPRTDQSAPSLRIAISAALLAAKLRGEPLGETVDLKTLSNLISGLPDRDRNVNRVQQLQLMIGQARQVSGK